MNQLSLKEILDSLELYVQDMNEKFVRLKFLIKDIRKIMCIPREDMKDSIDGRRDLVFLLLQREGPLHFSTIQSRTKLPRSTLYSIFSTNKTIFKKKTRGIYALNNPEPKITLVPDPQSVII